MDNKRSDLSKPPLNILVNPDEIRRKKPWEVDIQKLLEVFVKILEQEEIPDLRLCGSAALSSALIYRLKVESLFLFEKLKVKRSVIDRTDPPRIIDMPYRYEFSTTSLDDLVAVLEGILDDLSTEMPKKPKLSVIEAEPVLEVDTFSVQIQKALKELKRDIANILRRNKEILFSEYVTDMDIFGRLRTLLLLLFAANDGLIQLIQREEDILIVGAVVDASQ